MPRNDARGRGGGRSLARLEVRAAIVNPRRSNAAANHHECRLDEIIRVRIPVVLCVVILINFHQNFRVFSILAGLDSSQAHSLVISADWNAYELTEGNDDAYGQTVRRRVVLER